MGTLTIRRLDDAVKAELRVRAARHGRSMEEEAREILKASVLGQPAVPPVNLAESIQRRFAPLRGVSLKLPRRQPVRRPPGL